MMSVPSSERPIVDVVEIEKPYPVISRFCRHEPISGIYIIQNLTTDHCYVGASNKVVTRWGTHSNALFWGHHQSTKMQKHFNEDPSQLVYRLIEICREEELAGLEAYWMDEYEALSPEWGYNIKPASYSAKKRRYDTVTRIREAKHLVSDPLTNP